MPSDALIVEIDGRRFNGRAHGNAWVMADGLDGWFDGPEVLDDDESIPGVDGDFHTETQVVAAKRVNFHGLVRSSSFDWAQTDVASWAAALSKRTDIGFRVWVTSRWLHLREARIRGVAKVRPYNAEPNVLDLQFTVRSADPRKYGERAEPIELDATMQATGGLGFPVVRGALNFAAEQSVQFPGVFQIENPGTAEFYPTYTVTGPLDGFTITSESSTLRYDGVVPRGRRLVLSPYAGGRAVLDGSDVSTNLVVADWVPVGPGENRGYVFTPINPRAGSKLVVEYPNGAWW